MNYNVYILYAPLKLKSYVGFTNDLERRLWEHNNSSNSSFTSKFKPWIMIHTEPFKTKKEAMVREKWFKTGIGRKFKQEIIRNYLINS